MKRTILLAATAMAVATFLIIGTAQADYYTGCVTPGGTIIHLAIGETPANACGHKQKLIHLNNDKNNDQTRYNHLAVCAALDNAGAFDTDLQALGCPIDPVVPGPTVVVELLTTPAFFNDAPHERCGVKLEQNDKWGPGWHIAVYGIDDYTGADGGGYLASTSQVYSGGGGDHVADCKAICEGDDKCVAARVTSTTNHLFEDCDVFHHSDTVDVPYNVFCGLQPGGGVGTIGSCEASQVISNKWFVRCEHLL